MLVHLFGSNTRVALLRLFFEHEDQAYFVRELTREVNAQINSVRRELNNLVQLGIVEVLEEAPQTPVNEWEDVPKGLNQKKFYRLNKFFVLHDELAAVFSKSHLILEKDLMNQLAQLTNSQLLIMTGFFTGNTESMTDILIVGNVPKQKVNDLVSQFEQKLGREINYTIMPSKEFQYRREITDKFLYDILVNPKMVLIDQIGVDPDGK